MSRQEHYARLKYYEEWGPDKEEGFTIEIYDEVSKSWGLDQFSKLRRREGAGPEEEALFIHFSLAKELVKLVEYGYEISIARS